jgi:soluble lytic murein transglycosylase-like protein
MRYDRLLMGVLLCAAAASAQADIYAFSDAKGEHYSNVPADTRYVVVIRERRTSEVPQSVLAEWRRRAKAYAPLIDDAARRAALHPALLRAVVAVESAYDPEALSSKGAQGLMQLRPATAEHYGVRRPFDPADNLRGGARYLSDLLQRYDNDLTLALAAYNAGENAVDRYGRSIPPFPETRAYVPAVLSLYRRFLVGS